MRRRIRLTGRRQLSKSAVRISLSELGGDPLVVVTISRPEAFESFPPDSRVTLRLVENKNVEIVDLGTVSKLHSSKKLQSKSMTAPTCQLRVADVGHKAKGLLLASTDSWTLKGDDADENENSKGILQFLPADTDPQSWKLTINENDYPLVLVDKRIPNAGLWARNDPVFKGTVLPTIIRQIFDEILRDEYSADTPWVVHWMQWAEAILPGSLPPLGEDQDKATRMDYLERLVDSFCSKHELAAKLLEVATPEES
ncbi:MAG: hypothetical protein J7493_10430 [Porphyrobacter sp.]|nr:hypothetical protein [Porphyrobacter sp.]